MLLANRYFVQTGRGANARNWFEVTVPRRDIYGNAAQLSGCEYKVNGVSTSSRSVEAGWVDEQYFAVPVRTETAASSTITCPTVRRRQVEISAQSAARKHAITKGSKIYACFAVVSCKWPSGGLRQRQIYLWLRQQLHSAPGVECRTSILIYLSFGLP